MNRFCSWIYLTFGLNQEVQESRSRKMRSEMEYQGYSMPSWVSKFELWLLVFSKTKDCVNLRRDCTLRYATFMTQLASPCQQKHNFFGMNNIKYPSADRELLINERKLPSIHPEASGGVSFMVPWTPDSGINGVYGLRWNSTGHALECLWTFKSSMYGTMLSSGPLGSGPSLWIPCFETGLPGREIKPSSQSAVLWGRG